jgi:serine/threonine protein kinase
MATPRRSITAMLFNNEQKLNISDSDNFKVTPGKSLKRRESLKYVNDVIEKTTENIVLSLDEETDGAEIFDLLRTLPTRFGCVPDVRKGESLSDSKFLCHGSHSDISKASFASKLNKGDFSRSCEHTNTIPCVVKSMKESSKTNNNAIREFRREKLFLSKLCHPNILMLYGFGDGDKSQDEPFLLLERLDGSVLTYFLKKTRPFNCRPLPLKTMLTVAAELVSALQYLHSDLPIDLTIIHRDLKPDNIAFTESGQLKVIDFGLASCIPKLSNSDEVYELTGTILINFQYL